MKKNKKTFTICFTAILTASMIFSSTVSAALSENRLITKGGITRFLYADGQYASDTWINYNGKQYYFSADGTMHTGWLLYNGKKYYLAQNGQKLTGWQKIKKYWYFFNANGVLKTNIKRSQQILVKTSGSYAKVTMLQKKKNGKWKQLLTASGRIGSNGAGKTREGMRKTPTGTYSLGRVFGVGSNPGCNLPYTKVKSWHYWVDDPSSKYYNKFVDTQKTTPDWNSAEHLIDYPTAYEYAVAINYNSRCVPGKGSAFFLHCTTGGPTAGCVAVSRSAMIKILRKLHKDAKITIY